MDAVVSNVLTVVVTEVEVVEGVANEAEGEETHDDDSGTPRSRLDYYIRPLHRTTVITKAQHVDCHTQEHGH